MLINNLFIFIVSLFMVMKGSTLATRYASLLAETYRLNKYTVGFIVVAIIAILPETFISINASLSGIPSFGLGLLLGSNIADLTLIFALIVFIAGRSIKIESKIIKNHVVYPFILLLPIILGANGNFSRLEGVALILVGVIFYYLALRNGVDESLPYREKKDRIKNTSMLIFSMAILLVGSYFIVESATFFANYLGINPVLIGMLVVGLGTTMPEFLFSLKSVKQKKDSLAVGDILGTVLADATIVLGILALISPFSFSPKIIYITGAFMVTASFLLFYFMKSGKMITKKEAHFLLFFWVVFVLVEFFLNRN